MAISISPAVTFTEVDATGSVPAIPTTEGAIAGVFRWGPVYERILVSSESNLVEVYERPTDANAETFFTAASFLAYSSGLYAVRTVSDDAFNAGANVQIRTREVAETFTGVPVIARYPGKLGNSIKVSHVTTASDYQSPVEGVVLSIGSNVMKVYDASGSTIKVGDMISFGDDVSGRQNLRVNTVSSATESKPTPAIDPAPADIFNIVPGTVTTRLILNRSNRYNVGDFITISGATGAAGLNGTFEVIHMQGANVDIAFDSSGSSYVSNSASVVRVQDPSWAPGSVMTTSVTLSGSYSLLKNLSYATVERRWAYANIIGSAPKTNQVHIVIADADGQIAGKDVVLEVYEGLSTVAGSKFEDGSNSFYKEVVNGRSKWVYMTADTLSSANIYNTLTGGTDGDDEDTISLGDIAEGYDLFRNSDEVYVPIIMQGKARGGVAESALANYLVQNIALNRLDCVVTISPGMDAVVNNKGREIEAIKTWRNNVNSSSYWFADSGYKKMYDKYNDVFRWVPLNGDTAGLMARCLPWESPAGYNRGMMKNVVSLAFNPAAKTQRDALVSMDVNPVLTQTGQGTLLYGDWTGIGANSAFSAINVRRLFIYVEKGVVTYSARILFENNNEFTQARFLNAVEPFLRDIQGQYGLQDFKVDVGPTVNTPDVIDAFTFRGNIFIKPPRVIRYIDLKFIATPTGLAFEELEIGN